MRYDVGDDQLDFDCHIPGLRFERNQLRSLEGPRGWFSQKLSSSPGPLVSDFVTHEQGFHYANYGIHVGQDDRLTFMGSNGCQIDGYFVDCREDSPTKHKPAHLRYSPSVTRRLIVPRGVAHTFDNLDTIVTRDEPVWHSDTGNDAWNIDNDLVAVHRSTQLEQFPLIRPNRHLLPDAAHIFMSRLSQSLLSNPKAYLSRHLLTIDGKDQYVMFEPTTWVNEDRLLRRMIPSIEIPGVEFRRTRYAFTGPRSWTLVPSTGACVADVLVLQPQESPRPVLHARTRKYYTFLNAEGTSLHLSITDCRKHSVTFRHTEEFELKCDPRLTLVISNGVAYSISCAAELLVRSEHEIFVDRSEPRTDIPMFGQDLMMLSDELLVSGLELPDIQCPDTAVYAIAKHEASAIA